MQDLSLLPKEAECPLDVCCRACMKAQAAEARADAGEAAAKRWQREAEVGYSSSTSAIPPAAGDMPSHQLACLEPPHQGLQLTTSS